MADVNGEADVVEAVPEVVAPVVQFEPDPTTAFEMALTADLYVRRGVALDVALDYSDASIAGAEEMGGRTYLEQCRDLARDELKELQGTLVLELGAYIGETYIRNHGGDWGWATMPVGRAFGLRTSAGLTAFPLTKAKKRLLGDFGSLVAFYTLLVSWTGTGNPPDGPSAR
ncbi:MAG TPA: hypothetical protein VF337_12745 [Candidatus Limnocylindrales bacterium]